MLGTLACSVALAAEPPATPTPAADRPDAGPGASAVRVIRDKASGKLRQPTEDELASLLAAEKAQRVAAGQPDLGAAPPALLVREHANGMKSAVLGTEHLVTVKAVRAPDGRLVRLHTHPAQGQPAVPAQSRPTE
jgi:hypothetical protein